MKVKCDDQKYKIGDRIQVANSESDFTKNVLHGGAILRDCFVDGIAIVCGVRPDGGILLKRNWSLYRGEMKNIIPAGKSNQMK